MSLVLFWKRPGFWVAVVTIIGYCDRTALHGDFAYDDAGSVKRNVVVNGHVPLREVFERDYWGTSMKEVSSHKSFRPVTTLSFRWNWVMAGGDLENVDSTLGFHVVNVMLHGMVAWLVTDAAAFVFQGNTETNAICQLLTGLLFGLHPVHAEAVSNITSRGELLMSLFCLTAFLSYARYTCNDKRTETPSSSISSFVSIYVIPWICMTLSTFSKEQGATTLITLVAFDFIYNFGSVPQYLSELSQKQARSWQFMKRTIVLAIQTLLVCYWRYWLNGETSPDFIYDQNPAGFSSDRFTRIFSINWIYCLYVRDAVLPTRLCCDWSGNSIDLITSWHDQRIMGVLLLWIFVAWNFVMIFTRPRPNASRGTLEVRRVVPMAFFAFSLSPFLLSSNLLVVVGLMKADRVIYLPLLGFCILEALVFKVLFCNSKGQEQNEKGKVENSTNHNSNTVSTKRSPRSFWLGYTLVMLQLAFFARLLHQRNLAWSNNLELWMSAYEVNPKSYHTMYNCGYELSLKGYYKEAEQIMRPIGSAHVNGPSNTFVYAMTLYNLNKKQEARRYVEEALEVIQEQRENPGERNRPELLARTESNLLVAKALTLDNLKETGQVMYQAVQVDPRNQYAVQQAQQVMAKLKDLNMI